MTPAEANRLWELIGAYVDAVMLCYRAPNSAKVRSGVDKREKLQNLTKWINDRTYTEGPF